ncbi:MAG: putative bifunctional diguanylate cyclase/phosphodiesterase [Janthinobacterium lividum]
MDIEAADVTVSHEEQRIETLRSYCVLDTPSEPVFDDLTALAATMFNVPIVLISLVDEHRQFFKSSVGLQRTQTSRDVSFCAYTILHEKPMVILDAALDDRFRTNALVTGDPHIRFYAGAPLIAPNGMALGSFCVIDQKPRESFDEEDQAALQRFATLAFTLIEQRLFPAQIRRAEEEVLLMNERYKLATEATTEGIWDWDCLTDELFKSGRMRAIVGLEEHDSYVALEDWFKRVHPLDVASVRSTANALKNGAAAGYRLQYRVRHEDSNWRWVQSQAVAVRSPDGVLLRVVGSLSDITERMRTDPLTGEHTRASLIEVLDRRWRTARESKRKFAALVLHFDTLKRVGGSLGKEGGELLLIAIASRVKQTLSTELADVVARLSADEFGIVVDYVAEEADAVMYAGLLQAVLQVPFDVNDQRVSLSLNVGIVVGPDCELSAEEMLHRAQTAAHEVSQSSGRCAVYSERLREKAARRIALAADLQRAIEEETLAMHYQPKVDFRTGTIMGFEALCRWQHAELGNIPPDEFIPIAEEGDLILELGRWTLRESIRQFTVWRSEGLIAPSAVIAINLSGRQFADAHIVETISRKLALYGLPPECLSLEITEGTLIENVEAAVQILGRLKSLGITLDLDDFGTGYSSLSYLQKFPFDCLKVDRSFVRNMEQETGRTTLVRSITALAHAMGLRVVAEGVETEGQRQLLSAMGCEYGQGYLFSRPLPSDAVPQFLRSWIDLPSA